MKIKTFTLNVQSSLYPSPLKGEIIGKGDAPKPTPECIKEFKANRETILEPILFSQSKKHGTILHGAQSRNIMISNEIGKKKAEELGLLKPTYDYDVWAKSPRARALEAEKAIDKKMGCDIAYVKVEQIGREPGTKGKKEDFKRYTIVTPVTPPSRQEIDYATPPDKKKRPYKVITVKGVKHQDLESAYERAHELKWQPKRSFKTWMDIRIYQKYQQIKGED